MITKIKQLFEDSTDAVYCVTFLMPGETDSVFKLITNKRRTIRYSGSDCTREEATTLPFLNLRYELVENLKRDLGGNTLSNANLKVCIASYHLARIEGEAIIDCGTLDKVFGESFIDDIRLGTK